MLLGLFAAAGAVQLAYWGLLHRGFARARRTGGTAPATPPPVSVVVAARDEAACLPALLAALARQTHPDFEIVLVDDASEDATAEIARAWHRRLPNLRLVRVTDPQPPRKKRALTQGIDAATHDVLAFTDADCTPPPTWLAALARRHAEAPEGTVLVGYSPFRRAPGAVNRLARYETFVTGFLTAAAIGLGRPYMAVGRNLSYRRRLFRRLGGFAHSLHAMSGDDDLLVQEAARQRAAPVRAVLDPATFVPTDAPATWRAWLRQKRRHVSAGRYYDAATQAHLALFHATGVGLWLAPFALGWPGAALLGTKLAVQGLVLRRAAHVLRERDLMAVQPLLELGYAAYNLLVAPLGLARRPRRW